MITHKGCNSCIYHVILVAFFFLVSTFLAFGFFHLLHLLHTGAKHRDGPKRQRGLELVVEGG
jgi:hypothetical protein